MFNPTISKILGLDPEQAAADFQQAQADLTARLIKDCGLKPVKLSARLPPAPPPDPVEEQRKRNEEFAALSPEGKFLRMTQRLVRFTG